MCGLHQLHHLHRRGDEQSGQAVVQTAPDELVSSAERDAVVEQLRHHSGAGRLSLDEFGERVEEALGARTGAELRRVLRDLPNVATAAATRAARRSILLPYLAVNVVLVMVWAVTGAGYFWPIWPITGWGIGVAVRWRAMGRARQPSAAV